MSRSITRSVYFLISAATLFHGIVSAPVAAAVLIWDGSVGNWDTDASWLPGGIEPTSADDALINSGTVTIDNSGEVAQDVSVGNTGGTTGTLMIQGGVTLDANRGNIGTSVTGIGVATVTGVATAWDNNLTMFVGNSGDGTLNIEAGASVTNTAGSIGFLAGSTGAATVTGGGSTWVNSGNFTVGYFGDGTLDLTDGGSISNVLGFVGRSAGGSGVATVSGAGSTWTNSSSLFIGNETSGTLNIEAGGTVSNQAGFVGNNAGAIGTVTVTGSGSTWTNAGNLTLGANGGATLNLQDQGQVSALNILNGTGTSIINIDGGTLVAGDINVGQFHIGDALGATGSHTHSSGQLTADGIRVGDLGTGSFTIDSTATVNSDVVFIGTGADSVGTATVSGGAASWTNTGGLIVGGAGDGTLNIELGAAVSTSVATIGSTANSTGVVNVTGAGSTMTHSANLTIGFDGDGTLNILDQGHVSASSIIDGGGAGTGTLNIDGGTLTTGNIIGLDFFNIGNGAGTTGSYTHSGGQLEATELTVGGFGTGTLVIDSGATATSERVNVGFEPGSDGTATVTGTGSSLDITQSLRIGRSSQSDLTISDGATLTTQLANVGDIGATGQSTLTITGAGSTWNSDGIARIGGFGEGLLTIENSGTVVASSRINIGDTILSSLGHVRVTGSGSSLISTVQNTTGLWIADGTFDIEDGASVSSVSGALVTADAVATVTGNNSTWTNSGVLDIGTGIMTVEAGGAVTTGSSFIDGSTSNPATVTVTGSGSTWTSTGDMQLGASSTNPTLISATLNIETGALVTVGGTTMLENLGALNVDGGTLTLDGPLQYNDGAFDFTAGVINFNHPTQLLVADSSDVSIGSLSLGPAYVLGAGRTINLASNARVDIGGQLNLGGGVITAPSLLVQTGGALIGSAGSSSMTSPVTALTASTIDVTGGDLAIGDASAVNGFYSNGTTNIAGGSTLMLEDANDAVFDSAALVVLGNGSEGTLAAANGITLDFGSNVTGYGTIDTPDDAFKRVIANGNIAGNSLAQPITLNGYIRGVGTFDNVQFTGTHAPGLSPTQQVVGSLIYAPSSTLEIEIGGTTPGSGHDQILSSGTLMLGGTLDVLLINGFAPSAGDSFDILDWGSIVGSFDTISLPILGGGLQWDTSNLLVNGTLSVSAAALVGDLDGDGFVGINDLNIVLGNWNQNVPPANPLADPSGDGFVGIADLNEVLGNWNAGVPPTITVPEPASLLIILTLSASISARATDRDGRKPLQSCSVYPAG